MIKKIYIFLIPNLLLLDHFTPTANIFREFGAMPINLYLILGIILFNKNFQKLIFNDSRLFSLKSYLIFILSGLVGFIFSLTLYEYPANSIKNPFTQFFLQSLLILVIPIYIVIINSIIKNSNALKIIFSGFKFAFCIHITIFYTYFFSIVSCENFFYELTNHLECNSFFRPSGLFSEPSYYGLAITTFLPFIYYEWKSKFGFKKLVLALLLTAGILSIFISGSRTGIIALFSINFLLIVFSKFKILTKLLLILAPLILIVIYLYNRSVSDSGIDLSSTMRLGSTLLSLNISIQGWAIPGIGFGQFHFFYIPSFAPNFLFSSQEAYTLFDGIAEYRAHTFNFFTRLLLEAGIIGFASWFFFINSVCSFKKVLINLKNYNPFAFALIPTFIYFLVQDSFLYLPFYFLLILNNLIFKR